MEFNIENIEPELLKDMYKTMVKIRKTEERIAELLLAKEIICPTHLYIGQEAIATGVCKALRLEDYVFSNYRGHGHYLAKGGDIKKMVAELYGKFTGCCKGKGGSMHLIAPDVSIIFGSTAIVGGQIAPAVGAGLAIQLSEKNNVSVVFFGDGATEEGVFYEAVNFAALKKLPVIFICENNFYASHVPFEQRQPIKDMYLKTQHIIPSYQIDGNNVVEVFRKTQKAIERARNGGGPTLIECITYRHRGHVGPNWDIEDIEVKLSHRLEWAKLNPVNLVEKPTRTREDLDKWLALDPIKHFEKKLIERKILTEDEKDKFYQELNAEIEEAVEFARKSKYPDENQLLEDVYAK